MATEATAPDAPAAPSGTPRVLVGELTSALSAFVLLVVLFALPWYGVAGVPDPSAARPAVSGTVTGWQGLTIVRWILLATTLAALGSVVLHATQRRHGAKTDTSRLVAGLGIVSSGLLIVRVLIGLPASTRVVDQKLGALLGLACALGVALGGHESIREQRLRGRAPGRRRRRAPADARGTAPPQS